jgi:hypothetical protein
MSVSRRATSLGWFAGAAAARVLGMSAEMNSMALRVTPGSAVRQLPRLLW